MNSSVVIVLYNPSILILNKIENYIKVNKNFYFVLIDNTIAPVQIKFINNLKNYHVLYNNNINGIAGAQNMGIKYCLKIGSKNITFFDQDTIFTKNDLINLTEEVINCNELITAPICFDHKSCMEYPNFSLNKYGYPRPVLINNNIDHYVDICISSGTTVSINVFKAIGMFNESFFIDYVDIEWCLRAKNNHYKIKVINQVKLFHQISYRSSKFFIFNIFNHPPIRYYYRLRNSIYLFKFGHIPKIFAIKSFCSELLHSILIIFIDFDFKLRLKYIYKAILDGIKFNFK